MPKLTYDTRFRQGVRQLMVDRLELTSLKEAATFLGIHYMTLHKIMDGSQKPTVDHCIILLKKGKYNANWLFLGAGDMSMKHQATLDEVAAKIANIK